jgi:hypothetical protein
VHRVGVRGAFAAALVVVAWVGVVDCRAGFGGDGVDAAFEEFPVRAGEGEVLCCENFIRYLSGRNLEMTKKLTAPRIPKPSSMLPQIAAQQ